MEFRKLFMIIFFVAAAGLFSAAPAGAALKAGAAKAVITPEWPVYLGGYYYVNTRSLGVHDDLHVRALALNDGENTLIFMTLDVVIMGGVFSNEVKQMIQDKLGVPPENVTVSATHTHTGPEGYYEEFGKYPKEYDPKLKQFMQEKCLEAATRAVESMKPATMQIITLQLPDEMSNRHNPDGPEDPTSIFGLFRDEDGKVITGFLNFPAHATSAPAEELLISAGWPGYLTGAMEEKIGPDSAFVFMQGACGNISPRGTGGDDRWKGIENFGRNLADKIWKESETGLPGVSDVKLAGALQRYDNVPVRRMKSVREFASRISERTEAIQASDLPDNIKERQIGWLKERMGIENFMQPMIKSMQRVNKGRTATMVQALRIGDVIAVAFPGEPIAEVGMDMRKRFPDRTVMVLGYTGDHLGYLTTQEVYEEGGYEAGMGLVYPEATYKFMDDAEKLARGLLEK